MEHVMIGCIRIWGTLFFRQTKWAFPEEHDPGGWKIDHGPVICSGPTQTGTWLIILHQPEKVLD